ncbi:hypothetical protein AAHA92_00858 [Salvia divinorum]|uniref:Uncharacterized protein n=1 Tax=Salvia divinorum TaxID=28513 RepID=A0ABD1INB8_SALDI
MVNGEKSYRGELSPVMERKRWRWPSDSVRTPRKREKRRANGCLTPFSEASGTPLGTGQGLGLDSETRRP